MSGQAIREGTGTLFSRDLLAELGILVVLAGVLIARGGRIASIDAGFEALEAEPGRCEARSD